MIRPSFSGQQPERILSDPKPVLYREVRRKPLPELIIRSEAAVREILAEQSTDEPVSFTWALMGSAPPSETDEVVQVAQEGKAEDATGPAVTLVA
jgi:hypothetical protein